jgi:hypothetical protein
VVPVQALDVQQDMPVHEVVDRQGLLRMPSACAHRGAAETP